MTIKTTPIKGTNYHMYVDFDTVYRYKLFNGPNPISNANFEDAWKVDCYDALVKYAQQIKDDELKRFRYTDPDTNEDYLVYYDPEIVTAPNVKVLKESDPTFWIVMSPNDVPNNYTTTDAVTAAKAAQAYFNESTTVTWQNLLEPKVLESQILYDLAPIGTVVVDKNNPYEGPFFKTARGWTDQKGGLIKVLWYPRTVIFDPEANN